MIDVDHQISSVTRTLGTRTLEAGEARVLTISQTYKSDQADVWDALTNPERLPRWFLPVTGELAVGGKYQLEGNAGGTVERCDAPRSFAATWEFGGEVSWIEVTLTEVDGGTRFALEHVAHVKDELWETYGPGATGVGWDGAVMGLGLHLGGASPLDPADFMAWAGSEEGLRFNKSASDKWAEASIAAGTPPEQAWAAAERTTAFYTPES
ncbi:SRPBCC family protein [Actinokineospora guangxiensis]|uniref:SRPBCC family protein n=1 Tax=Actinokineospora guangxiensis TaxID=1490288 RepID=A0ABW0EPB4_9PSEU